MPIEPSNESPDDIDGVPIDPDLDGEEMPDDKSSNSALQFNTTKFKPSKWEIIDPEVVESQAITSKWENLDKSAAIFVDDDIDGKPMEETDHFDPLPSGSSSKSNSTEQRASAQSSTLSREVLYEIERKVVHYQDELEGDVRCGRQKLSEESISLMTDKLRKDLQRAAMSPDSGREYKLSSSSSSQCRRSRSRSRSPKSRHSSSSSSSINLQHHSKRYVSPPRRSRSRSPNKRRK